MKFFINPCFACAHLSWDTDGDYATPYSICSHEEGIDENGNTNDSFPIQEAPRHCVDNKYWCLKDTESEGDYFNILGEMDDFFGYKERKLCREIALSVSSFNSTLNNRT